MLFPDLPLASYRLGGEAVKIFPGESQNKSIAASLKTISHENALEWTCYLTNTASENSPAITEFYGLDITIPCDAATSVQWNGLKGDDCSSNTFFPIAADILPGGAPCTFAPAGGRSSNTTGFPFFDVTVGDISFTFGLGWPGQWTCSVVRDENGVRITAGQQDCDYYLLPGETVRSVRVLVYSAPGALYDNRLGFRETLRRLNRTYAAAPDTFMQPISCQVFDRYYWNDTNGFRAEAPQIELAKRTAATAGFDTFWVDALWFRDAFPTGVGNYDFEKGFPNGFKPLADVCHQNGLKLMVWFEPERIDIESDTAKKFGNDPDFLLRHEKCDRNLLLNLGNSDAVQWISDTIITFMKENQIDIFRTDYNIDPLPYWQAADVPGRKGITELRYVEGLLKFWDNLWDAFPGLLIDNCSSGGRRLDVETLTRSISMWRSDLGGHNEDPKHRYNTWSQNITVGLSRYLPFHQNQIWSPEAYTTRSAMSEGSSAAFHMLTPDYDPALHAVSLQEVIKYRGWRRCKMLPLTPVTNDEDCWFAYTMTRDNEGCALAFRRDRCADKKFLLKLPEIDTTRAYECELSDEQRRISRFRLSGASLADGITLTCDSDNRESFVLEYRKC